MTKYVTAVTGFTLAIAFIAISLALPFTVSADICTWQRVYDSEGHYTLQRVCVAEYYAWQAVQPNWCLYQALDEVEIVWSTSGGNLHAVAWYVTPVSDPGRDADYFVSINGNQCVVQMYPW